MDKLWAQVCYEVPNFLIDDFSEFLLEFSPDGVVTDNRSVDTFSLDSIEEPHVANATVFFPADDSLQEKLAQVRAFLEGRGLAPIPEPEITYIREEDWSNSWKSNFKPSRVGERIVVKPTWEEYLEEEGDIVLELDPGMAFGTGTHPSTRLCMEILEKMFFGKGAYHSATTPESVLDVGTGSGILAITAAKLGAAAVTGIDIDPQALLVAEENAALNDVEKHIKLSDTPLGGLSGEFDIVVANILAEDLVRMAPELIRKAGRHIILSGILTEKEEMVVKGFSTPETALVEIAREGEWSCLAFRRAGK